MLWNIFAYNVMRRIDILWSQLVYCKHTRRFSPHPSQMRVKSIVCTWPNVVRYWEQPLSLWKGHVMCHQKRVLLVGFNLAYSAWICYPKGCLWWYHKIEIQLTLISSHPHFFILCTYDVQFITKQLHNWSTVQCVLTPQSAGQWNQDYAIYLWKPTWKRDKRVY